MSVLWTLVALGLVADPKPGEYLAARGGGQLSVSSTAFHLWAFGANGHTCEFEGSRTTGGGKASEGPCTVSFTSVDAGVAVKSLDDEACRHWCGARAWFEDTYLVVPPVCLPKQVKAARVAFAQHYQKKQWGPARSDLQPVLEQCAEVLDFTVQAWLRNDLAITLHHLKDDARCVKLLEPLRELATHVSDEVMSPVQPSYEEEYRALAKATVTNLALCGG